MVSNNGVYGTSSCAEQYISQFPDNFEDLESVECNQLTLAAYLINDDIDSNIPKPTPEVCTDTYTSSCCDVLLSCRKKCLVTSPKGLRS